MSWSFLTGRRFPYSGAELREVRKKNGVGRPPAYALARVKRQGWLYVCLTSLRDAGDLHGGMRWVREKDRPIGPAARRRARRDAAQRDGLLSWRRVELMNQGGA